MTKPQYGKCYSCGCKALIQPNLLYENPDEYMNRISDFSEYDSKKLPHPTCRQCFIAPDEDLEWDEDGHYRDLNLRESIWDSGDWDAEPYRYADKPKITQEEDQE